MPRLNELVASALAMLALLTSARAQDGELQPQAEPAPAVQAEPTADPEAMKAFTELIKSYRERPALTVKTTIKVEVSQDGKSSNGSEVKGEFIFGPNRTGVVKLRGFTCYLSDGNLNAIHEETDHSYFSTPDDGSPYYTLMSAFQDIPFPELAIFFGEDAIDDVLMQFHPKAPYVQPKSVAVEEIDGKPMQKLVLASENESIEMHIDPQSKLIQDMELQINGGEFVQPGAKMVYKYDYEYQTHEQPLEASTFALNPGQRQRVDLMFSLMPKREAPPAMGDPGEEARPALAGQEAPGFVLATADGNAVDLEDMRGRVVVLDFWATWCPPCMQGLPMLHQVARWANDEQLPVTVLTVNVWEIRDPAADNPDARLESARKTWEKKKFTLPIAMDYTDDTAVAYGVRAIPTTVVIRSDGIVHSVHQGGSPSYVEDLKADIKAAMQAALEAPAEPEHDHDH